MNAHSLEIGLVILSITLRLGWHYLQQNNNQFWQTFSKQWFGQLAQPFYFIGIPYIVIIFGILPPSLLGLKGINYFNLIDVNSSSLMPQVQQALTLMLLEWLFDSSTMIFAGLLALLIFVGLWLNLKQHGVTMNVPHTSVLYTLYYALHWAFYRAVFWSITGDLYLGVVFGSGLVLLEWILIDILQKQWPTEQPQFLTNSIILILTATIFFYSPNLWLLFPLHLALVALVNKNWGLTTVAVQ